MLNRVRPALKAGLLPVWRDNDTLQLGIDPRRAVALTGMGGLAAVISLLDGSRDRMQVLQAAAGTGIPAATVDRVLTLLAAAGVLDDFAAGTLRVLSPPWRSSLAGELATVSLARQDADGGARALARRRAARVSIHQTGHRETSAPQTSTRQTGIRQNSARQNSAPQTSVQGTSAYAAGGSGPDAASGGQGTGRIAASIAGLLSAAGVDVVSAQTEPTPRGRARTRRRAAAAGGRPDLAVIVGQPGLDLPATLMRDRIPHLSAYASEAIGVVGPFVVPGRTACLRCLDHARTDRDPAWPVILAQLAGRQPVPLACDAPLAAAVAAQASFQALAFIDGAAVPGPVTNGTLELVLPAWQWRRRTWPPHPACDCGSHPAR
jgi:bacteriocin biosynthesis cyclodehydratase domain-containing protein